MLNKNQTIHVPIETRVYYGLTYSVGVVESGFKVVVGDLEEPLEEVVECPDVSPGNSKEMLKRAHAHAQKLILEKRNSHNPHQGPS